MTDSSALGGALTRRILIGMAIGVVVGVAINVTNWEWGEQTLALGLFDLLGQIFLKLLKMLMVPVVLVSLICGVTSLANPKELGRLGGKAVGLYMLTTGLAIALAITVASLVGPGEGFSPPDRAYTPPPSQTLSEVILGMVPQNPINAMAEAKMLQLILFAVLFGLAISLAGEPGKRIRGIFSDLNDVVMMLVTMVMQTAPIGVLALMAKLCATLDLKEFSEVLTYFLTVVAVLAIHGAVTYPMLLKLTTGLNPLVFLSKMRTAMAFAFSTSSSNATLPVTLRTTEERLGVNNSVASFTVPLGATINMDGTAIMQGCATIFIANAYGVDLTLAQLMTVVLMAVLASIGAAGVPGVGIVLLATVLEQVGLPVEGIALILGVDRLLDMMRTVVNITGDAAVTTVVAHSENEMDTARFNDPDAGTIDGLKEGSENRLEEKPSQQPAGP
ncbi:MAG: dicarboxylate/amino acid:cation symporter [Pseudomonadota bacterium]